MKYNSKSRILLFGMLSMILAVVGGGLFIAIPSKTVYAATGELKPQIIGFEIPTVSNDSKWETEGWKFLKDGTKSATLTLDGFNAKATSSWSIYSYKTFTIELVEGSVNKVRFEISSTPQAVGVSAKDILIKGKGTIDIEIISTADNRVTNIVALSSSGKLTIEDATVNVTSGENMHQDGSQGPGASHAIQCGSLHLKNAKVNATSGKAFYESIAIESYYGGEIVNSEVTTIAGEGVNSGEVIIYPGQSFEEKIYGSKSLGLIVRAYENVDDKNNIGGILKIDNSKIIAKSSAVGVNNQSLSAGIYCSEKPFEMKNAKIGNTDVVHTDKKYIVTSSGDMSKDVSIVADKKADDNIVFEGAGKRPSADKGEVTFTAKEDGTYYFAVVKKDDLEPVIDTTTGGVDFTAGTVTIKVTLSEGAQDVYFIISDANGNVSGPYKVSVPAYEPFPLWALILLIVGGAVILLLLIFLILFLVWKKEYEKELKAKENAGENAEQINRKLKALDGMYLPIYNALFKKTKSTESI